MTDEKRWRPKFYRDHGYIFPDEPTVTARFGQWVVMIFVDEQKVDYGRGVHINAEFAVWNAYGGRADWPLEYEDASEDCQPSPHSRWQDAEPAVTCWVKWDGCSHLRYYDGYLHFDEQADIVRLHRAIEWARRECVSRGCDTGGSDPVPDSTGEPDPTPAASPPASANGETE